MARPTTGLRVLRSTLHLSGTTQENQQLQFNLGEGEGVRIHGIMGILLDADRTGGAAATLELGAVHYLADEEDVPEILPLGGSIPSAQEVDRDSELIWGQSAVVHHLEDGATGEGGVSVSTTPNGLVTFPIPFIIVNDMLHPGRIDDANMDVSWLLMMYYQRLAVTQGELLAALARRR